jgi:hypothetical protein
VYVVRDAAGRVIAASHPEFQKLVSTWPPAGNEPQFFRLEAMGAVNGGEKMHRRGGARMRQSA